MTEPASQKYQRQQLIGGSRITLLGCFKNARDVAHALQSSAEPGGDNSKRFKT